MVTRESLQLRHTGAVQQAQAILLATNGRARTDDEERAYQAAVAQVDDCEAKVARLDAPERVHDWIQDAARGSGDRPPVARGRSFAAQIRSSEFAAFLKERKGRLLKSAPAWATPTLNFVRGADGGWQLLAAAITSDPSSGGDLVLPDADTEIIPLPTRPLVVADLMRPGTTDSNTVTTMQETAIDNQAAAVLEGALKPQSGITFAAKNEPVRKIATWLEIVEEMLEDVAGMAGYLDTRLRHFVQLEEDDQLQNGDGIAPNIQGIRMRPGLAPPVARVDPENNADAIYRQISAIQIAQMEPVSGIVMHPSNWDAIALLKDTTGNYIASGGPFASPERKFLWGREVALTPMQPLGVATVGAYRTASQFRRRTPIRVVASNSHADFFIKNRVAVVGEERGALVVTREGAFGDITGLTAPGPVVP